MLQEEWESCTACSLGESRQEVGGALVFGEGSPGGVMLIGEGPGKDEEAQGSPFVGKSGVFLRDMLKLLEFDTYYMTNTVCCRSWDFAYDNQGNRLTRKNYRTKQLEYVVRDEAPKPLQMAACRSRLLQQIYLVDPVLIITLGSTAAEAVLGRQVSVQAENGTLQHAYVPGAGQVPSLTPKGSWARKTGSKGYRYLIAPTVQNKVEYPVIPLVHPAFAIANKSDRRQGTPMPMFAQGLEKARNIYAAYKQELNGDSLVTNYELSDEAVDQSLDEEGYIGSHFN